MWDGSWFTFDRRFSQMSTGHLSIIKFFIKSKLGHWPQNEELIKFQTHYKKNHLYISADDGGLEFEIFEESGAYRPPHRNDYVMTSLFCFDFFFVRIAREVRRRCAIDKAVRRHTSSKWTALNNQPDYERRRGVLSSMRKRENRFRAEFFVLFVL